MNARLFILPLLGLLLSLAGGCASGIDAEPTAEVISAKVTEQSPDGVRVEFVVLLSHDNKTPLPLSKADADVTIGNNASRSIDDVPHRTLPVGGGQGPGKQTITLPISYPSTAGVGPGSPYTINGSVTYEPPGEVRRVLTESGIPLPTADFSKSGRLE